jgi:hypothetical protein
MRHGRFVPSVVLGLLLLAASPAPPVYAQAAVATAPGGLPMARPESVGLAPDALAKMDEGMQSLVDRRHLAGIVTLVARHGKVVQHKAAVGPDREVHP